MHQFVDGEWVSEYDATDETGAFVRSTTSFRDWVGGPAVESGVDPDPDAAFPVESGRYHLYVSYACPWAHRTLVTRALTGLTDAVTVDVVDPWRGEDGWQFSPETDGCTPDTVNGFDYLREAYLAADPEVSGRVTVPVLWDRETDTIVNNESREIMRMLDVAFEDLATRDLTLYPEGHRDEVDRLLDDIYDPINNGVYRAGFADAQSAYDAAVTDLFDALDRYDDLLADRRYLAGDVLTEADVAMFTTLVRFDEVYHTHFMCNRRLIREYDNLWPYLRDLYQLPGVADTVRMDHVKEHYYTTHPDVSPTGIVPTGPDPDFAAPHDRDRLPGGPPEPLRDAPSLADD